MSEPASISSGIAERYAKAVFELAKESNQIPTLEADVDALDGAIKDSADLQDLLSSPVYSRDAQQGVISALSASMGLSVVMANTLSLMTTKRRLFVVPQLLKSLRDKIEVEKGELTAEVTSATQLSTQQIDALAYAIHTKVGKFVKINMTVDQSLIGGLIVKVGSTMIDTSISSKLANLQNVMKEVG